MRCRLRFDVAAVKLWGMLIVKAHVRNGRLILDEPTDAPDGSEIDFVSLESHEDDALDATSRAALHEALRASANAIADGQLVDGKATIARLRNG